ncbi:hypothetical protein CPAV1605_589 [seawater metagenome]|uniref:Patatin-like phospholipase n=1 Tax=seawater metagenome TaxID=1561972 RepID=A0A5E8CJQ2_9ZZZZ
MGSFLLLLLIISIIHAYFINNIKSLKPPMIYFGGASWGCAYYIGCYKAMQRKWGNMNNIKIYGDSSGALIALTIVLQMNVKDIINIYTDLANEAKNNGVFFKMTKYHNKALNRILKNKDDYLKVNNKLSIGTTTIDGKHIRTESWNSNQDLISDLHASFHIPFYCTYPAYKNKKMCVDGAFSVNLGSFPRNAILIGMEKKYDINGNLTNKECMFPLMDKNLLKIVDNGYNDFMAYKLLYTPRITFYNIPLIIWYLIRIIEYPFTNV